MVYLSQPEDEKMSVTCSLWHGCTIQNHVFRGPEVERACLTVLAHPEGVYFCLNVEVPTTFHLRVLVFVFWQKNNRLIIIHIEDFVLCCCWTELWNIASVHAAGSIIPVPGVDDRPRKHKILILRSSQSPRFTFEETCECKM